jgi:hypothetical protein
LINNIRNPVKNYRSQYRTAPFVKVPHYKRREENFKHNRIVVDKYMCSSKDEAGSKVGL